MPTYNEYEDRIIVAEDQRINLEALKISLKDIELYDICTFTTNGR